MQPKRFIWAIIATLVTAALAGCATPEETTDDGTGNDTGTGDGTVPPEDDTDTTPTGDGTATNDTADNASDPAGKSPGEHEVIEDNKTLSEEDNGTVMAEG